MEWKKAIISGDLPKVNKLVCSGTNPNSLIVGYYVSNFLDVEIDHHCNRIVDPSYKMSDSKFYRNNEDFPQPDTNKEDIRYTYENVIQEVEPYLDESDDEKEIDLGDQDTESNASTYSRLNSSIACAAAEGHLDLVKYLYKKGASLSIHDGEVLKAASVNFHLPIVKFILDTDESIGMNEDEYIFLHLCKHGKINMLKYMVKNYFKPRELDEVRYARYGLKLAIRYEHFTVIDFLVINFDVNLDMHHFASTTKSKVLSYLFSYVSDCSSIFVNLCRANYVQQVSYIVNSQKIQIDSSLIDEVSTPKNGKIIAFLREYMFRYSSNTDSEDTE